MGRGSVGVSVEPVAALCVMARSAYHGLEGVDCWDQARRARV